MYRGLRTLAVLLFLCAFSLMSFAAGDPAQTLGGGVLFGVVTDPTGAVVPGAAVSVKNPITGFQAKAESDKTGNYRIINIPFNHYHVTATAKGFAIYEGDVEVRTAVPIHQAIALKVASSSTQMTVEGGGEDLVEVNPIAHTDLDQSLINRLPVQSVSSPLSSAITMATPGVAADSNGLFHPLGEHADTSFSVDGQPITDQQSKVFSNQIPGDAIQSMEVISGVPPAEYGDKTSLVIQVNTKNGLGVKRPTGSVVTSYGSFGTVNTALTLANGGDKWGNYVALSGLNTGRFLDSPEFVALHDKGNSQNYFDRIDFQPDANDQLHLNLLYSRSWFQIPNQYDQQAAGQDQRQLMNTFNISPAWTHVFNSHMLLSTNVFVRQDQVNYYPSANLFSDQPATLAQRRRLTNAGLKLDLSYAKGHHNAKFGFDIIHTFLTENFRLGLTDPAFNPVCLDSSGNPVPGGTITDPNACTGAGYTANPGFLPGLLPFDLTRGGQLFQFNGHADIKQEAFYAQDSITLGSWNVNLGVRGDNYNGLSSGSAVQPRVGLAYNIKRTNTVLRASYGRMFETPYNENLVLSSATGAGGLASSGTGSFGDQPLKPGTRNQFNVGFQQSLGRFAAIDAEYFWKFTKNDYDFDTLFNTPLAFPIQWRKSKIDGLSVRVNLPTWKGLTAFTVMGHSRARFFGPESGGLLFNSPLDQSVFRIDHDQAFEQTTNLQYQPWKRGPWFGFAWRYDSGLVAGAVPDLASLLALTPDQQAQVGFFCGSTYATPTQGISNCTLPFGQWGATRAVIPAPGTENADKNPPRIAPRHLFDASIGDDNLFRGDRYKWSLRVTATNLTNESVLYNFLSTFSGTHFVPPRAYTAEIGFHF